jgi:hypothetical protein
MSRAVRLEDGDFFQNEANDQTTITQKKKSKW